MLVWLLTSLAYAAEGSHADFSFSGMFWAAGPIAKTVIIMLAMMGLVWLLVSVERLIAFLRARGHSVALAAAIVTPLRNGDVAAAKTLAARQDFKAGYLTALLRVGLAEFEANTDEFGVKAAKRAVEKASNEQLAKLKRGFGILGTIASTAPFVGLFGTTVGVITSFQQMASGAGAGLDSVSVGISEALTTTALGILVAVVAVWTYNFFNAWLDKVGEELASSQADFVDWAEKQLVTRRSVLRAEAGK